jgi:outer membrane biosynthesis protein TonB
MCPRLRADAFRVLFTRSREDVLNRITGTAHPLAGAGSGLVDAKAALGVKTAPKPTPAPPSPPPIVKPHPAPPPQTAKPTPHATSKPAPRPKPAVTPSAFVVPPSTPSPTPSPTDVPQAVVPGPAKDEIPIPLAAAAGMLVGLAGAAVLVVPRFLRR